MGERPQGTGVPSTAECTVRALFGPDGPIAKSQPGFSAREEQVVITEAIDDTFCRGGCLLVEAPPGTGKTLAAAVAAVRAARRGKRVLMVATTHELLTQTRRTIEQVRTALGIGDEVSVTLLRGRSNYGCGHRIEGQIAEPDFRSTEGMTDEETADHQGLLAWLEEGHTDLTEAPVPIPERRRRLLVSTSQSCRAARAPGPWHGCAHTEVVADDGKVERELTCAYLSARRGALRSQIVITTLAMALLNLESDGEDKVPLLGEFDLVLFDEAHEVVAAVADAKHEQFGIRYALEPLTAVTVSLNKSLDRAQGAERESVKNRLYEVKSYRTALESIWESLTEHALRASRAQERRDAEDGVAPDDADMIEVRVDKNACAALKDRVEELAELAPGIDALCKKAVEDHREGSVIRFAKNLSFALDPALETWVRWVSTFPGAPAKDARLHCAPSFTRPIVKRLLHEGHEAVVCMSATLSTGGRFDWAMRELAMPKDARIVQVASPFRYDRNALWYRPQGVPKYERRGAQHREYAAHVAPALRELVRAVGGRTLVLCNAKVDFAIPREALRGLGFAVYEQGAGGLSNGEIARRFKAERDACLIGTEALFGTGFDAPGDTLECVVLLRLPWPRRSPIDEHKEAWCRDNGVSFFASDYEPRMLIKGRQDFGRLVRTRTDIGVFATFDARANESLQTAFARSLPRGIRSVTTVEDVASFFAQKRAEGTSA